MSYREVLRARAAGCGARIVLPEGDDPRIQRAATTLARLGIAEPILLGGSGVIPSEDPRLLTVAEYLRARRPTQVRDGIDALDQAADPVRFGAALVALGEADGCVAGVVTPTAAVLRAGLWALGTAVGVESVSAAMYLGLSDGGVLTYTDIAVVPEPTPDQMAQSAIAAARDRHALVGDQPRVAFLSYSTHGSAGGAQVARVREAVERCRVLAPDLLVDGELQVDAALVPDVAARKAPTSPLGGAANILVFPGLDAGNIAYKLTERLAGATAAGPLLQGLSRPMSDLSRGADPDDIVDVAAMVALQATARSNSRS